MPTTVLLLADPFTFPVADLLALCNERVPGLRVIGGLASAANMAGANRLVLDGRPVSRPRRRPTPVPAPA